MDTNASIPRKTFNEILLDEVRQLRPKAFPDFKAATFADGDEERAKNLRELYGLIASLSRPASADPNSSHDPGLSALCFSGGGIRSATFNLGVLRGLAEHGLFRTFDYLSSVSGGGYIASWVRTWVWRESQARMPADASSITSDDAKRIAKESHDAVENALAGKTEGRDPLAPEPKPLDHLREYSNYLTPQLGLFSPDTWTLGAIAVRNLLLNWLVILPALSLVTAVPLFVLLLVRSPPLALGLGHGLLWAAIAVAAFSSVFTHRLRRFAKHTGTSQGWIVCLSVVPTCMAACLLSTAPLGLALAGIDAHASETSDYLAHLYEFAAVWCIGIPLLGWLVAEVQFLMHDGNAKDPALRVMACWEFFGLIFSGVIAGLLLVALVRYALPPLYAHPAAYSVLAFPTLLALYLLARTIFVAFASLADRAGAEAPAFGLEDSDREWWARLSGWILMAAVMWLGLSTICIFGTYELRSLEHHRTLIHGLVAALGSASGIVTAVLGASSMTVGSDASRAKASSPAWVGWVMALAAPLFVACVFVLVAQATIVVEEMVLNQLTGAERVFNLGRGMTQPHHKLPLIDCLYFLIVPAAFLVFIVLFGNIVNINRFSLHGMYRNRLVRAYLGASNTKRQPDPFTGFDDDDNPSLHNLWSTQVPIAPFPLINTTLNLVKSGDKLAWQQRKAESFSMTPLYCGNFHEGYRSSEKYGGPHGISVGTAVTISGAAANPNMGSSSLPAISFLLALFNLRLGAWLGNTNEHGDRTCGRTGPSQALLPLVAELFGLTTATSAYVNLSDGGHFDNLGLYEVVLRRCRNIVVCDAGQDPTFSFEDLGNAIRKIRIDFGVEIQFERAIEVRARDARKRGVYCAIGNVLYDRIDGKNVPNGKIIYIKPTLRARGKPLPYDVFSYAQSKPTFPHEPTTDQWFSESQFESYRSLAAHAVTQIIGNTPVADVHDFVKCVEKYLDGEADRQKVSPTVIEPATVPETVTA